MAGGHIEQPRTTCAQGGALAALNALPDVIAISHVAEGCAGNLTNPISVCSGYNGEGYCGGTQIPTSAIREKHVVFGGAERLREEIRSAQELLDAKLFVVTTGCMTEMIGDDVQSVVREFEDAETPVIAVNTPSFAGDAYVGYEIVLDGIFNGYIKPSEEKDPKLVNIFGLVPNFDPFFRGDLTEIKRILERVGLKVNTFFTPDQTFDNVISASKASLNIQFSHVWGSSFVKKFEEIHGTPYFTSDIPIGAVATEKFLRELSKHIKISKKLLEKVIAEENDIYYKFFTKTVDVITNSQFFYYSAVVANSNYALSLAYYLSEELGWHVEDIAVTDILSKSRQKKLAEAHSQTGLCAELLFEPNAKQIEWHLSKKHFRDHGDRYFDAHSPFFLLGSSIEKYTADTLGALTLSVSYPVRNKLIANRGYAGFNGALTLLEDLISVPLAAR